jgi:hypothetical protein
MTIAGIVKTARHGARAGSGGSWRIERIGDVAELHHYAHKMLTWRISDPSDPDVLDYDIGHGSVSDQGAMNRAFRVLGLPLYFSRAGGASIGDISARLAQYALIDSAERCARDGIVDSIESAFALDAFTGEDR